MIKVGIIGLGFIGTSLGMALKQAGISGLEIVGTDKERDRPTKAQKAGAIDRTVGRLADAARDADLVIITTPSRTVRDVMETISYRLKDGCVVTDTGDSKRPVLEWAEELLPRHVSFIGGHPMLGGNADRAGGPRAKLFQDRPYAILPAKSADEKDVKDLTDMIRLIGAKPYYMDVAEHDSFVAAVNHLPVLLSAALLQCTSTSPSWDDIAKLASDRYRSVTDPSGSEVKAEEILGANDGAIVYWIDAFIQELYAIRRLVSLEEGDESRAELDQLLSDAWDKRISWLNDLVTPESVAKANAHRERLPTASEGLMSLFIGERQARRLRDFGKDKRSRD
ncbi:MAG: prephenate dehydrogenase/arogenate dehydrogenase family protein [Dehalococcoidia bacterium]|nr:prephenate dehydrogenase/arogenate dehydrogenase family protein [Dehalococcoidia bacterium]